MPTERSHRTNLGSRVLGAPPGAALPFEALRNWRNTDSGTTASERLSTLAMAPTLTAGYGVSELAAFCAAS
jgi:hypothetical protein